MKLMVMSDDIDDIRAVMGLLLAGDSPFDVAALTQQDIEDRHIVELEMTVEREPRFVLKMAGLQWFANKVAELEQVQAEARKTSAYPNALDHPEALHNLMSAVEEDR